MIIVTSQNIDQTNPFLFDWVALILLIKYSFPFVITIRVFWIIRVTGIYEGHYIALSLRGSNIIL
jgi:hypothetical protein